MALTYRDDILAALRRLGGKAHRMRVIEEVRKIRRERGATTPRSFEQTVQQIFETHCVDSGIFCKKPNLGLFQWPHGKGDGTWSIVAAVADRYEREGDR